MDYYHYKYQDDNKTLMVSIESELFQIDYLFWHSVFFAFEQVSLLTGEITELFIVKNSDVKDVSLECNVLRCNVQSSQWKYWLLYELEQYLFAFLGNTVLHASGFRCFEQNFIVLGNSMAGKSTLTYYLCENYGGFYLDDDSIYIKNNSCCGFCFPAAIRNLGKRENTLCSCVGFTDDAVMKNRFLIDYVNKIKFMEKKFLILLVRYSCDEQSRIKQLTTTELIQKLIFSIKYKHNIETAYHDVTNLITNCVAYSICYTSSNEAVELIKSILGEGWYGDNR